MSEQVESSKTQSSQEQSDFATQAEEQQIGIVREFWEFLTTNKKWWLTPIIVVLLLIGALIFLGGGVAAPFIYTLF